jgi:hypothetical protein
MTDRDSDFSHPRISPASHKIHHILLLLRRKTIAFRRRTRMNRLFHWIFLGIATTTASSIPTDQQQQQQVITVPIARSSSQSGGGSNRRSHLRSRALATTKKVALYNEQDSAFLINVTLPSNKWYLLQFDTGSSDTWFRGQYCYTDDFPDDSCTGRYVSVDPLSKGLVDLQLSYYDTYGSGSAGGEVYKTAVTIGGISSTIAVGVTSTENQDQGIDGILGMGYPSLGNIYAQETAVSADWLGAASSISTKAFGVYLSSTSSGEVTFGGYDTAHYSGKITWIPLVKYTADGSAEYGYFSFSISKWTWSVTGNSKVPGGKGNVFTTYTDPNGATNLAVADTGSTAIMIPTTPAIKIAKALKLSYNNNLQGYTVPCSNSLPAVNFHYGSTTFTIPSSIYTYKTPTGVCFFGIAGGGDGLAVFGDVFTRAYYTMFDKAGHRVGFALAK